MPLIASEVLTDASSHLNDQSQQVFTTTVMLPFLRIALRDLQGHFLANDIPILHEETTQQTIAAGGVALTTPPTDIVVPISMKERTVGDTLPENWIDMTEKAWVPDETQTDLLRWWVWKEEAIALLGATSARSVKLKYWKLLAEIASEASGISMEHAQNYLGYRTAELVADRIGENPTRAQSIGLDRQIAEQQLIDLLVKKNQSMPIKRMRYGAKFWRFR